MVKGIFEVAFILDDYPEIMGFRGLTTGADGDGVSGGGGSGASVRFGRPPMGNKLCSYD